MKFILFAAVFTVAAMVVYCNIMRSVKCSRRNKQLMKAGCPDILMQKPSDTTGTDIVKDEPSVTTCMIVSENHKDSAL